jgi:branched-chain amino acid transport system substrate-binding protein
MGKYNPQTSLRDQENVAGHGRAETLVAVLRKCGDDLMRANVLKQASEFDLQIGMLRPGIRIRTSPGDYQPIKELFLMGFQREEMESHGSATGAAE